MGRRPVSFAALALCLALTVSVSPSPAAKTRGKAYKMGPVVTRVATATATATAKGQLVAATATCPRKKKATGGGWFVTSTGEGTLFVYASVMTGNQRGWTNSAYSDTGAPQTLTTFVYCRRVKKRIADVAATTTTPPGLAGAATVTATCPRRRELLSGGFSSDVGAAPSDIAAPFASIKKAPRSWRYRGANQSSSPRLLTSHAYCAKGIKPGKKETFTEASQGVGHLDLLGTPSTDLPPACTINEKLVGGEDRRLSGGGFELSAAFVPPGLILIVTQNRIEDDFVGAFGGRGPVWVVSALNLGTDRYEVNLTPQALCLQL